MMPSKKKKYNARFPAGRIKKIMQTDEEVGKVAQAVPIIISRTLELFVESLLTRATRITAQRNAKTLSPSHLKQCIRDEARFDFLRDLVKNIPDVSAAEERESQSGENSPTSVGCSEPAPSTRRTEAAETPRPRPPPEQPPNRPTPVPPLKKPRLDTPDTSGAAKPSIGAIDLTKRPDLRRPNFYQETLPDIEPPKSVIKYANPQPSTSKPLPKMYPLVDKSPVVKSPVTPVLNIDFTKNLQKPEFKVLDKALVQQIPKMEEVKIPQNFTVKALSRSSVSEDNRKTDLLGSGNLEIDEDYDT